MGIMQAMVRARTAVPTSAGETAYHAFHFMSLERRLIAGDERWRDVTPPPVRGNGNTYADGTPYPCLTYPPMDACGDAVAQAGHTLFVSGDRGDRWDEIALPGIDPDDCASTLAFAGGTLVLVGTAAGAAFRVRRCATGWHDARVTALASPRQGYLSDIASADAQGTTLWITCSRPAGARVFRSSDGGQTWSDRSGNLPVTSVNAIAIDPEDPRRIFAATDVGMFETVDAGGAWRDSSKGLPNAIVGDLILHAQSRPLRAGMRGRTVGHVPV